ncbi:MAG: hypothetical protein R3D61_10180 [Defluviimonas denitrificans]
MELARIAVAGLLPSATTAWMTASTFNLLPDNAAPPAAPATVSGQTGFPLYRYGARDVPVDTLRKLSFPADDAQGCLHAGPGNNHTGTGLTDQGTGASADGSDSGAAASEIVYMLHTPARARRFLARSLA